MEARIPFDDAMREKVEIVFKQFNGMSAIALDAVENGADIMPPYVAAVMIYQKLQYLLQALAIMIDIDVFEAADDEFAFWQEAYSASDKLVAELVRGDNA